MSQRKIRIKITRLGRKVHLPQSQEDQSSSMVFFFCFLFLLVQIVASQCQEDQSRRCLCNIYHLQQLIKCLYLNWLVK
ncbi:hypothetical protein IHE45_15G046500 [Dioscorea alata]|uniref:Uncharacterized protein n=1 Tax=Dioscorea alata TaxID=55571 RepID=A0ACB7UL16_DIOAL|nr:hypothetical protein IHE45_15G046500 [Dioscorea alata]